MRVRLTARFELLAMELSAGFEVAAVLLKFARGQFSFTMTARAPANHSKCWRRNSLRRASSRVFSLGCALMSPAVFARINPASSSVLKSAVASPFQTRVSALRIVDLRRWIYRFAREPENNQDGQDGTVDYEMPGKRQVAARGTEATASYVDSLNFCPDRRPDKDEHESARNGQRSRKGPVKNERETTENFQPGKIKGEPHPDRPREDAIVDSHRSQTGADRAFSGLRHKQKRAGQNGERTPNDKAPVEGWPPTRRGSSVAFCHSSHPPSRT